ncbi:beta-ketoacyl synthase N-terminal-like domain-containing protein [Williamsia deligens]|uniref:Beta-ketoacyl synthase N-terminal-like domain-containing protein n=1 Tax=Williamsia deligens TaxID=321325 RepID=A0ABW3G6A4_9NOCA|nr:beta-ketoacyl synthase N-terminal-like domain-containing protein [Williamsia deligens]
MGAVTGYGWGRRALWDGLVSGKPSASMRDGFGPDATEPGWVSMVPEGGDPGDGPTRYMRALRFAAREAIDDALERGWTPGRRVGVVHAAVMGDTAMHPMLAAPAGSFSGRQYVAVTPSTAPSLLMAEYGFHGPVVSVSSMCASGVAAIITARTWLAADMVDDVIVVATDLSATPEIVHMFTKLGVAITDDEPLSACRPFQEGSRGFSFGEAAIAFTMTNRADAPGYADVLGGSLTHDGYHPTSIDPSLTEVRRCVDEALTMSGVDAGDIRYLNAHGPGTAQCDAAEGVLAREVVPGASVFSVKPLVGHCQAAAGAVEVASSLLSFENGRIPASPQVSTPTVDTLLDGATPAEPGLTLKTSLGMGGYTAAMVFGPTA